MAYVKTLSIDGTKYDIKDANAVQCGSSSSSVAQSVYGKKTFVTGIATKTFELTKQNSQLEGGEITFKSGDTEANAGKDILIDRYNGTIRIVGTNSSDETKTVLQEGFTGINRKLAEMFSASLYLAFAWEEICANDLMVQTRFCRLTYKTIFCMGQMLLRLCLITQKDLCLPLI